jgi:hypothetical protein
MVSAATADRDVVASGGGAELVEDNPELTDLFTGPVPGFGRVGAGYPQLPRTITGHLAEGVGNVLAL